MRKIAISTRRAGGRQNDDGREPGGGPRSVRTQCLCSRSRPSGPRDDTPRARCGRRTAVTVRRAREQPTPCGGEVRRVSEPALVGSDINLAAAEVELAGVVGREVILRDALEQDGQGFDYVLMDCAPSLGVLTLNALSAATEVFIPLQPHFLALHGLGKLLETTALVAKRINPSLKVTGIVVCLYEATTKLAQEVIRDLEAYLERSRGSAVPWSAARVLTSRIRRNIKLAECPSFGEPV